MKDLPLKTLVDMTLFQDEFSLSPENTDDEMVFNSLVDILMILGNDAPGKPDMFNPLALNGQVVSFADTMAPHAFSMSMEADADGKYALFLIGREAEAKVTWLSVIGSASEEALIGFASTFANKGWNVMSFEDRQKVRAIADWLVSLVPVKYR